MREVEISNYPKTKEILRGDKVECWEGGKFLLRRNGDFFIYQPPDDIQVLITVAKMEAQIKSPRWKKLKEILCGKS